MKHSSKVQKTLFVIQSEFNRRKFINEAFRETTTWLILKLVKTNILYVDREIFVGRSAYFLQNSNSLFTTIATSL